MPFLSLLQTFSVMFILSPISVVSAACTNPFISSSSSSSSCVPVPTENLSFAYYNYYDQCMPIEKGTLLCQEQHSSLYKSIEDCQQKCTQSVALEFRKEDLTCFDSPCQKDQLCVMDAYQKSCFVAPCPQYACTDAKVL